jgi:putative transcription antitermination factor YqgF
MTNFLGIDYGRKRVGIALSVQGIISPQPALANDSNLLKTIAVLVETHQVDKVFVGISQGSIVKSIHRFVQRLSAILNVPIELVEEAASTLEAQEIFLRNRKPKKRYHLQIDSIAAAVILRRALGD